MGMPQITHRDAQLDLCGVKGRPPDLIPEPVAGDVPVGVHRGIAWSARPVDALRSARGPVSCDGISAVATTAFRGVVCDHGAVPVRLPGLRRAGETEVIRAWFR